MSVYPSLDTVLDSVARFLRDDLLPHVEGARGFNLRVSINAIELARREIAQEAVAEARERERLLALFGGGGDLDELRERLCDAIAIGDLTPADDALHRHLRATAIGRLAIDQPGYSAYRRAVGPPAAATS